MARKPPPAPIDLLESEAFRFEFFQAVRLLERAHPHRKAVGRDAAAVDEVARFRSLPALEFPASQIHEFRLPKDDTAPAQMVVTFFGLTGLNGALPHHYTEWIVERLRHKDRTLRDFIDLFNHRLTSLFYRAWEKYRYWVAAERALVREREETAAGGERLRSFVLKTRPRMDLLSQTLLDFSGLGSAAARYDTRIRAELRSRTAIADDTLRFYSGLFAQQHRSAVGMEGMLRGYFGYAIQVEQLRGQWLMLDDEDRSRLGSRTTCLAGRTAVAGRRVWDVAGKFRIQAGPLSFEQFCDLLPIGTAYSAMIDLSRLYAGMQFDFDLELILKAEDVPRTRLGRGPGIGARLGWTTWCRSSHFQQGAGRVVLGVSET